MKVLYDKFGLAHWVNWRSDVAQGRYLETTDSKIPIVEEDRMGAERIKKKLFSTV